MLVKSIKSSFSNPVRSLKRCFVLLVLIAVSFVSRAQPSFEWETILQKTKLERYFSKNDLSNKIEIFDRGKFLKDSLNLSRKDYHWHCLEMIQILSSLDDREFSGVREDLEKGVKATKKFESSYIHRLFLFVYGSSNVVGESEYTSSMDPLLQVVELSRKDGDKQMEFDAYLQIANIYIDANERKQALKWLDRAKPILNRVFTPRNANLYYTARADAENFRRFTKGAEPASEEDEKRIIEYADKAIYYGEQVKKAGKKETVDLGLTYHIRADVSTTDEEELKYSKLSLENKYDLNNPWGIGQTQLRIGHVYAKLEQFELAKKYMDSTRALFTSDESPLILKRRFYTYYSRYFKMLDKPDSLVYYLTCLIEVNRELNTEQVSADLQLNESKFKDQKQKSTIREQKLTLAQEKARTNWIIWSLVAALVLLSTLLFIFIRLRKRKLEIEEKNTQIEETNIQLEGLLEENKVLLNETHHRVKNNLQVISSLLESQVDLAENSEVEEAIISAQSRIGTMAYVHDLLYKQKDHSNLEIGPYLESLATQVARFHRDEDNLHVTVNCDNIQYPLHRAIHMGILVNELLTNSHKHARVEREQLRIEINLVENADNYILHFKDNGPGLPKGLETERTGSIGLYLLKSMARQLHCKLSYENNDGSVFILDCKK